MYPEIEIGPVTLQTFGMMFALGFIVAGAIVARWLKENGRPVDWAYEIAFAALIGGVVGARLYYVVENWSEVSGDLVGTLFSGGGLVWYGGAVGGAIGVLLWALWRRMANLGLLDMAGAPLAAGYAIGRIGCQLSGDGDYGPAWDGPWAMAYPDGTVPISEEVHPTPIYETLAMGLAAYVLWRLRYRFRAGILFALYLVIAGAERFLTEFVRRTEEVFAGLTMAQWISIVIVLAGVGWIALAAQRGSLRRDPADVPEGAPASATAGSA